MIKELQPTEQIDAVLKRFPPQDKKHAYPKKVINDLLETDGFIIDDRRLIEILLKLVDDGYLRTEPGNYYASGKQYKDVTLYFLTFKGELFQIMGGYTQQLNDIRSASDIRGERDRMARIYEKRLLWATRLAGIGACALVLWEMTKWLFHHECWHLPF